MKAQITPTKISLKDLPFEGRDFDYSRETGELDAALKDLVGQNPYSVKIHITPMGNAFDLKGHIQTKMDLQCAKCGGDFKFTVDQKVNEVLVQQAPLAKGDFHTKANHAHEWTGEGPDYMILESDTFNVAEYVHEAVALAEPLQPIGRPDCDPNCESIQNEIKRSWLTFGENAQGGAIKANPFQVLEKIKLKS
jgi:uncharacterized metal-binding protein YceD (DUF177 family)